MLEARQAGQAWQHNCESCRDIFVCTWNPAGRAASTAIVAWALHKWTRIKMNFEQIEPFSCLVHAMMDKRNTDAILQTSPQKSREFYWIVSYYHVTQWQKVRWSRLSKLPLWPQSFTSTNYTGLFSSFGLHVWALCTRQTHYLLVYKLFSPWRSSWSIYEYVRNENGNILFLVCSHLSFFLGQEGARSGETKKNPLSFCSPVHPTKT